jgi:hypothetical protein
LLAVNTILRGFRSAGRAVLDFYAGVPYLIFYLSFYLANPPLDAQKHSVTDGLKYTTKCLLHVESRNTANCAVCNALLLLMLVSMEWG